MSEYDSILNAVKEMNDVEITDINFDQTIISHINSSIAILTQLGVGTEGFQVTGVSQKWEDYITDIVQLEMAKEYIAKRVGLLFNPPRSQFLIKNIKDQLEELTYRLNLRVDP